MQRRLALLITAVLLVLALLPAFYLPGFDSFGQDSSPCYAYYQLVAVTGDFFQFNRDPRWIEINLPSQIAFKIPTDLPASTDTRAPPA